MSLCIVCGNIATESGIDKNGQPKRLAEFCYKCKREVLSPGSHLHVQQNGGHEIRKPIQRAPTKGQVSYHPYFPIYT